MTKISSTMIIDKQTFGTRIKSILAVDFRRMFTMPLFYIMAGISFVMPILILVMTTMIGGTPNHETGEIAEGFTNVWQAIGSTSSTGMMSMDLTGMCNINMLYFLISIMGCIFVSGDFTSGYAKSLFTVRAKKMDYVVSKTLVCFVSGAALLFCFFIGAMLGGGIAGLSFDTGTFGAGGIVACMFAKIFFVAVFASICVLASVCAKQKLWLAIMITLGVSMLLFTMIPMMTPLDSGFIQVILCLAGGALFSVGIGAISNLVLNKTNLV